MKAESESTALFRELLKLKRKVNAAKARSETCVAAAGVLPPRSQLPNAVPQKNKGKGKNIQRRRSSVATKAQQPLPAVPAHVTAAAAQRAGDAGPDVAGMPPAPGKHAAAAAAAKVRKVDFVNSRTLMQVHGAHPTSVLSKSHSTMEFMLTCTIPMTHNNEGEKYRGN